MVYVGHGGACCGIFHLFELDRMSVETFDREVNSHFIGGNRNRILEVILSERQVVTPPPRTDNRFHASVVEAGGWPIILAARGFALAEVWRNSNTGNLCYRFIKLNGDGTGDTMGNLSLDPLPFVWDGNRTVTLMAPPAVEVVRAEITFVVGDEIRYNPPVTSRSAHRGQIGRIMEIGRQGSFSIRWEDGATSTINAPGARYFVKIRRVTAAVDINLPMEVYVRGRNRTYRVTEYTLNRGGGLATDGATVHCRSEYADGWFHLDTGEYGRRNAEYILRNVGDTRTTPCRGAPEEIVPAVPARVAPVAPTAPTPVLTEYFAQFRTGRRAGPFTTEEAAREAYPRVLQIVTRRVLSDGTADETINRR